MNCCAVHLPRSVWPNPQHDHTRQPTALSGLSAHSEPQESSVAELGAAIKQACPEVVFAFPTGSAANGLVAVGSDLDVALYVEDRVSWETLRKVHDVVELRLPGVHCDLGSLNQEEPVYRFEALKGHLLFVRTLEVYLRFYSLTCREYESQMADYERQLMYRVENRSRKDAA